MGWWDNTRRIVRLECTHYGSVSPKQATNFMLHSNMEHSQSSQLALEDLLADLRFARKHDQLGRLALLAYCDVKRWARLASKTDIADTALQMFSEIPCSSKVDFLQGIDKLIAMLELHDQQYQRNRARFFPEVSGGSSLRIQY